MVSRWDLCQQNPLGFRDESICELTESERFKVHLQAVQTLRMMILRKRLGVFLRKFSLALSHSDLYKWFCGIYRFALPEVPGKSVISVMVHSLPPALIEEVAGGTFGRSKIQKGSESSQPDGNPDQHFEPCHSFCGSPMKQKGFEHPQVHMGLSILSHNLWVLARLKLAEEKVLSEAA